MIRIIINADDLGKDHKTNMAIEEALREGVITSSTIMANSNTWVDVHRIVNNYPNASFGVHLNLTEGPALTDSEVLRLYGIVDERNCFTSYSKVISNINTDLENAIFNEWDAQVNKIINGEKINVTHFDGHHHIHMNVSYTNVIKRLVEKYGVRYVRRKHNTWAPKSLKSILLSLMTIVICRAPFMIKIVERFSKRIKARIDNFIWLDTLASVTCFTDYFNGYEQALEYVKKGYQPKQSSVIELMCHPGHPSFIKEYDFVRSHEIEKYLYGACLCSYESII